jgi:hypothetical protein
MIDVERAWESPSDPGRFLFYDQIECLSSIRAFLRERYTFYRQSKLASFLYEVTLTNPDDIVYFKLKFC